LEKPFTAYKGDEAFVFVCYSHGDSDTVYPEIAWLREQGFNVWYDEGISPGTVWRDELADSIDRAALVIFFVSPRSVDSVNCQREVNFAVDHDIPVLAVHLEDTDLPSGVDLTLSTVQAILKFQQSEQDYRIKLLFGVSERIKRGVAITDSVIGSSGTSGRTSGYRSIAIAVLGIVAGGLLGWLVSSSDTDSTPGSPPGSHSGPNVVRAELNLDAGQALGSLSSNPLAISHDGQMVVYAAGELSSFGSSLYKRDIRTGIVTHLPGTDGAGQPFFSPDGKWIGFSVPGALKKVAVNGGAPITLIDQQRGQFLGGATWTADDRIVFKSTSDRGLQTVSANDRTVSVLTDPLQGEEHMFPHALPNGDFIFTTMSREGSGHLRHFRAKTGEVSAIDVPGVQYRPVYVAGGYLVWSTIGGGNISGGSNVLAATFDPETLAISSPIAVIEQVQTSGGNGIAYFSVSGNGSLIYMPAYGPRLRAQIVRVDRQGISQVFSDQRVFHYPRLSPDDQWIIVSVHEEMGTNHDLFLYQAGRHTGTKFTSGVNGHMPLWTPSGERVTFARRAVDSVEFDIYWKGLDEEGNGEPLLEAEGSQIPRSWSLDGKRLLYETSGADTGRDLWVLTPGEDPVPFLTGPMNERAGVFSPDGHYIAYVSDAADGEQVYVRPYPGPGRARRVSVDGGAEPHWSPGGVELIYRSLNGRTVMSAEVTISNDGSPIRIGEPELLFQGMYTNYGQNGHNYSISSDGEHFLMLESVKSDNSYDQVNLVLNWAEELKREFSKD
jgi:Tol biopolymer transport system component